MITPLWQGTGRSRVLELLAAILLLGLIVPKPAVARKIRVVGSSTDLISITKEIGKNRVTVYSPFPGYQEPELWVEEVFPSWAIKASRADIYVRIGLFADVWADTLIRDARNPRIFPGEPGYVDASQGVKVIEVPTGPIDRSRGEIHIQGNPHYLLDPLNAKVVADNILRALIAVSPRDTAFFQANAADFKRRIDAAMIKWEKMAAPLRGKKLAAYHKTWSYLLKRFGLETVGYVEPKPGIEPSPQDIRNLTNAMVREQAYLIIHAPVYHPRLPRAVAREVQRQVGKTVTILKLPAHVGGVREVTDYFALFDYLLTKLNEALR
jgi:zinc/manganese transport system substrate-binding protein